MKIDFYSKDGALLKENIHALRVVIKSNEGVPIGVAMELNDKQFIVHHAGDPNFKEVMANLGIPVYIDIIRTDLQGSGPAITNLANDKKLILPEA